MGRGLLNLREKRKDRSKLDGLKLWRSSFRLNIRRNFLTVKNCEPEDLVCTLSLKIFKEKLVNDQSEILEQGD